MIDPAAIFAWVDEVSRLFKPAKVILFGSHASGGPTEDSDVDLLVVMPYRGASYRVASRLRLAADAEFPMDIIVRSPAEIRRRLAMKDYFLMDILEQGLVLYDADNSRVGQQGRRRLRSRLHSAAVPKTRSA